MNLSSEAVGRRVPVRVVPAYRKLAVNVSQAEMFPLSLDEMVDSDDACRVVSQLIDLLDVKSLTTSLSLQGGVSYHPRLMLKLWMFGLWDGERSSRRIEKRCRTDIRYKWLAGGLVPDHTTLHRFRRKLGSLLDDLLAESVDIGRKNNLGGLGRACIDGTKLPAAASQWRVFRQESEAADADLDECEEPEAEPAVKAKKKRVAEPSKDADARTMKARSGQFVVGFSGQCLHDCESDLVLAVTVSSDASDVDQLVPTLAKCLELHQDIPGEILADAGYDSPANAQVLHDLGIEAYVGVKGRHMVWTLDEKQRPVCPAGHVADRSSTFMKSGVQVIRLRG